MVMASQPSTRQELPPCIRNSCLPGNRDPEPARAFPRRAASTRFRDKDGLWARVNLEEVATIEGLAPRQEEGAGISTNDNPTLVARRPYRAQLPPIHALARLEKDYQGEVTVVTQNIDPLHEQAGAKNVIHMHGRDGEIRCMKCPARLRLRRRSHTPHSICPNCNAVGEPSAEHRVVRRDADAHGPTSTQRSSAAGLFLSIGTSGEVLSRGGLRPACPSPPAQGRTPSSSTSKRPAASPCSTKHIYGPRPPRPCRPMSSASLASGWPE